MLWLLPWAACLHSPTRVSSCSQLHQSAWHQCLYFWVNRLPNKATTRWDKTRRAEGAPKYQHCLCLGFLCKLITSKKQNSSYMFVGIAIFFHIDLQLNRLGLGVWNGYCYLKLFCFFGVFLHNKQISEQTFALIKRCRHLTFPGLGLVHSSKFCLKIK